MLQSLWIAPGQRSRCVAKHSRFWLGFLYSLGKRLCDKAGTRSSDPSVIQRGTYSARRGAYGAAHLVARRGAIIVIRWTVDLTLHLVITWAYWTYFYPYHLARLQSYTIS